MRTARTGARRRRRRGRQCCRPRRRRPPASQPHSVHTTMPEVVLTRLCSQRMRLPLPRGALSLVGAGGDCGKREKEGGRGGDGEVDRGPLHGARHWDLYGRARHGAALPRLRYWKLSADELAALSYPEDRILNWDIKCVRPPEEEARFVGVFLYRNGTPRGYEPVRGIVYYHNNVPRAELPSITGFLRKRFGGRDEEKGERVFLVGSAEIYGAGEIASLARSLEAELGARATITLEFGGMTEDEAREAGLPEAKLLPVPTK